MKVEPKIPRGYCKLRVGSRVKKTDLEPECDTEKGFIWSQIGWSSGVDDWRVEKGQYIIRKRSNK